MAGGPYRTKNGWQVKWREGDAWQSETLVDRLDADEFKVLVERAGNRWPVDEHGRRWVRGEGFPPPPDAAPPGTPFLEYAGKRIRTRVQMGFLGPEQTRKYTQYARTIAGSMALAPVFVEQIEQDEELALAVAMDPEVGRPLLHELAGGMTDQQIAEHAQGVFVEDLDADAIRAFMRWQRSRPARGEVGPGVKWATIRKYHGFLHGVLHQAYYDDLIAKNPCKITATEIGRDEPFVQVVLSPEEFWILHSAMDPRFRDFIEAAVGCGLRFGELTASRVCDWHPAERRLRVEEAWKKGMPGTGFYRGRPKTAAGVRDVFVGNRVAEILDAAAAGKPDQALLFTAARGGFLRQNSFYEERWLPAVRAAHRLGLEREGEPLWPRFHDLRHTHISWLRKGGLANEMIRGMVGHTDEAMTERYGEIPVEVKQQAITAIDASLRRLRVVP